MVWPWLLRSQILHQLPFALLWAKVWDIEGKWQCQESGGISSSSTYHVNGHVEQAWDHQNTADVQRVDLVHYLTNNTGQLRHSGTQTLLGSAHPRDQRHTGTQAPLGSVHPKRLPVHAVYHKAVFL